MLVTAFTSRPRHPANGTKPDLPAKIICTMRLSPQAGFHALCKGLRGHVDAVMRSMTPTTAATCSAMS